MAEVVFRCKKVNGSRPPIPGVKNLHADAGSYGNRIRLFSESGAKIEMALGNMMIQFGAPKPDDDIAFADAGFTPESLRATLAMIEKSDVPSA